MITVIKSVTDSHCLISLQTKASAAVWPVSCCFMQQVLHMLLCQINSTALALPCRWSVMLLPNLVPLLLFSLLLGLHSVLVLL